MSAPKWTARDGSVHEFDEPGHLDEEITRAKAELKDLLDAYSDPNTKNDNLLRAKLAVRMQWLNDIQSTVLDFNKWSLVEHQRYRATLLEAIKPIATMEQEARRRANQSEQKQTGVRWFAWRTAKGAMDHLCNAGPIMAESAELCSTAVKLFCDLRGAKDVPELKRLFDDAEALLKRAYELDADFERFNQQASERNNRAVKLWSVELGIEKDKA